MAAYVTESEFGDLALAAEALNGISSAIKLVHLEAASRVADSYLQKRFTLPLSTWEHDLRIAVSSIAAYTLLGRKGFRPGSGVDEMIVTRYTNAIEWLKAVAKGEVEPVIVDASTSLEEAGPLVSTEDPIDFSFYTGEELEEDE